MDANELYDKMVGPADAFSNIRNVVDELADIAATLSDDERAFVVGAQANIALNLPLGDAAERTLKQIRARAVQRLHTGL